MTKKIILIGYGSHAKKRIIPSLQRCRIKLFKIFKKKNLFSKLSLLNIKNKKDFLFYICTPPKTHFKIIKFLITKNYNVVTEKPSVLKISNIKYIKNKTLVNNDQIFLENLMYIHSKIYLDFKNYWKKNKKKISKIEINFLIPNFFKLGFRKKENEKYLIIDDIGIYPISLLNLMGIKFKKVEILSKIFSKKILKKLSLKITSNDYQIFLNIGENSEYKNNIIIDELKNNKVFFDKIFSGIETDKKILYNKKIKKIKDHDCFVKFFSFNFSKLRSMKEKNIKLIEKNLLFTNLIKSKI